MPIRLASIALASLSAGFACTEGASRPAGVPVLPIHLVGRAAENIQFTDATSAAIAPDGRIFVADWYGPTITVLNPNGSLMMVLGGSGAGPGEFRAIRNLEVTSRGTVAAWDPILSRVTEFSLADLSVASISPINLAGLSAEQGFLRPFKVFPIAHGAFRFGVVLREPVVGRTLSALDGRQAALVIVDPRGSVAKTLKVYPSPPSLGVERGGQLHITPHPFQPQVHVAVGPEGRLLVADGSEGTVMVLGRGESWDTLVWIHDRKPILDSERQAIATEIREIFRQKVLADQANFWPAIWNLGVDQAGQVWVKTDGRPDVPEVWSIFGDGAQTGRVTLPVGARLLSAAHGWLVAEDPDEYGIPALLIFRMSTLQ